ncbi:hypothetical protein LRD18_08700 [Halorhodospira halochloris]|uniref:hypothetical protein n=1 Tax=Halorhodospira halochloris TaxID=1052 RepID=UPI001EE8ABC7|nr:hypothetical protein [Halorhodospira halochloris]MCG5530950.1 hypothetical protein [Halorhodospira halochloris]MCG5549169.1 hypothetical protein [Halorhodospira halochloris]
MNKLPDNFPERGPVVICTQPGYYRLCAEVFQTKAGVIFLESGWQDSGGRFGILRGATVTPMELTPTGWHIGPVTHPTGGEPYWTWASTLEGLEEIGDKYRPVWEEFLRERERWGLTRELARKVCNIDEIEAGELKL